ncbi:biofilm regulation protein phosphatase SiaA [Thioalkalivibrio sp. ALE11]|uniref:biofilm regulation protein phosphatase SiaA n=1 Tax=Thioalkalivibrio sp. ALE11 TaxID=1265494 RepID=UPI000371DED1|nr:biofilm regulation protein phosphatase SiaA [Thioalkalivibrio sp. ALE11]
MADWGYGLRAKSVLALVLACLVALLPLSLLGWQVVDNVRGHFGEAYAVNITQLNAQNILAPVSRELALSRRLADSVLAEDWLRDEDDGELRERFFREAQRYKDDFRDGNYFLISADSRRYYTNDGDTDYSESARYTLDPDNPDDDWFFATMAQEESFNINVNPDEELEVTRVWINVLVEDDEGERLGLAGTGLDLDRFLEQFLSIPEAGVTPMILDRAGAIQAHPDPEQIAFGSAAREAGLDETLPRRLGGEQEEALRGAMDRAEAAPGEVELKRVSLEEGERLLALTFVEELDWHVVSAVDLQVARVVEGPWFRLAVVALVLTLGVLMLAFAYGVDRVILRPLRQLSHSARAMADGDYAVSLPSPGRDEVGDLTRAFDSMATQIRHHTEELEDKVSQRTRELEDANRAMAATQKKINDSIDYAGLIQRALLPDSQLRNTLGQDHFVLWHPRDGVGGDFYLFRAEEGRYLIGVVDCAGHGVPGALMTMLARAAFDDAMNRRGLDSPAGLLHHADDVLREMVRQSEMPSSVATNLDAGLVLVEPREGRLRFAGARIGLYWSDGDAVEELGGGRRALCDRRKGEYEDQEVVTAPGRTWYMVTDGYLDQAGGELGFGFGNERFAELLQRHAGLPMAEQARAIEAALSEYQGEYQQRDDITVLAFRVE